MNLFSNNKNWREKVLGTDILRGLQTDSRAVGPSEGPEN